MRRCAIIHISTIEGSIKHLYAYMRTCIGANCREYESGSKKSSFDWKRYSGKGNCIENWIKPTKDTTKLSALKQFSDHHWFTYYIHIVTELKEFGQFKSILSRISYYTDAS